MSNTHMPWQGVGKTLTAGRYCEQPNLPELDSFAIESVAKATGKPLFSVSVSDIGLVPSEVEHNLRVLFELAAIWRAVMLL